MFEIGDTVRVVGSGEMRRIVGIGPGDLIRIDAVRGRLIRRSQTLRP